MERARRPAIDAHNHLGRWLTEEWTAYGVSELLDLMEATNVVAIVNLDGRWGDELERNLERYDRRHPERFATFCQLDWDEAAGAGAYDSLVTSLERSVAAGARGLKVWKDLGLHARDERHELLMPDDPRLSDVWEACAELGVPVTVHTADPLAFFDPVDASNERLEELLGNPDWSYADRERFPRFEELMRSFEALVAAHPRTTFIGAHVACNAEDLAWVGKMLEMYPNLNADIAARIAELGRQPRAARELFLGYPDRILFGTDMFPPSAEEYAIHFRFLETADEHFAYSPDYPPPQGRWSVSGLDLPDDVLTKLYASNARRLIPGLGS